MTIKIRDANEVNLLTGATLNAAGTTTGTSVALDADATNVTFVLSTTTVTGTGVIGRFEVQVSSDNFATDTRSLGTFDELTEANDNVTRYLDLFIPGAPGLPNTPPVAGARWVRVEVDLSGTTPVFTGSTLFARIAGYGRNDPTRTA